MVKTTNALLTYNTALMQVYEMFQTLFEDS